MSEHPDYLNDAGIRHVPSNMLRITVLPSIFKSVVLSLVLKRTFEFRSAVSLLQQCALRSEREQTATLLSLKQ